MIRSKYNKKNLSFIKKIPYIYLVLSVMRLALLLTIHDIHNLYYYEETLYKLLLFGVGGFLLFIVSMIVLEKIAVNYYSDIKEKEGSKSAVILLIISIIDVISSAVMLFAIMILFEYQLLVLNFQIIEVLLLIVYLMKKKKGVSYE
ncbi:hypothetical protein M2475_002050 [Breznakia sp. PF5-3]|uniref:hypothetical protein n=1 Tax=unclassified Breznakia TaxID=2623764 RepID=UPI002404A075|nr:MULTISPECIES: hypothetical protein [unclassified Breznakia]MDF9825455.1 hypothetical protein [Breznakia sp. PM6-1]MDF9836469.1 hypothetical protein [Breznakia sp. PF5-3]MDF9838497.1 hypothetical protein [Breznakia sp. PFB2-8]MDF9860617.1 hypothetical protein [Breznakia sp. PH5-24]